MRLAANRRNLSHYVKDLLGNNYTAQRARDLINECVGGFVRETGHISHSRAAHLERIDKLLGNYGVEGILLGEDGQDVSGTCDPSQVAHDVQYSNAGDTYAMTIMYYNGKLLIGDWGSIVESIPA